MKPTALVVDIAGIPDALKAERRWVCWRYVSQNDRWTKVPCTISGQYAKHNQPSSWTSFDEAIGAYQSEYFDGIGYALGDGWAGIDLDKCVEPPGLMFTDERCEPVISAVRRLHEVGAYFELSPSASGYKVIGRSARIGGEINFGASPPAFTPWNAARFFAITGHAAQIGYQNSHGEPIFGDPTVDLTGIIENWFPARAARSPLGPAPAFLRVGDTRGTENIPRFSDDEVVKQILATPQADKFIRLVRGDMSEYGDDHSRADQALVSILAYWCQGDLEQVDRLFRHSALMRPKWNAASYRRATLAKAVQR